MTSSTADTDMASSLDVKPSLEQLSGLLSQNMSAMANVEQDIKPDLKLLEQMAKRYNGASASSSSASAKVKGYLSATQESYAVKLKKLKDTIKDYIFVNGAICDEVLRTEEKLARVKEERRFLLRKLLQFQSISDPTGVAHKADTPAAMVRSLKAAYESSLNPEPPAAAPTKGGKGAKRKLNTSGSTPGSSSTGNAAPPNPIASSTGAVEKKRKGQNKDAADSTQSQGRPKKGKSAGKKTIPPLMLDSLGRPMIPMMLGDITLHSMGEIVCDRPSFHCTEAIFPAGYCITRVYVSLHKPDKRCLYTCKISEGDDEPLFEIAPEDSSDIVFKAATPSECHTLLLRAINDSRGFDAIPTTTNGLDFFGLSNYVIQNLIQSIPGARKCSRYKWVKFEIDKSESNDNYTVGKRDPTINYDAFVEHVNIHK